MGAEVMACLSVIPAQAGIHRRNASGSFRDLRVWIPAYAGMTKVFA